MIDETATPEEGLTPGSRRSKGTKPTYERHTFSLWPAEKAALRRARDAAGFAKDSDFFRMRILHPKYEIVDRMDRILQAIDKKDAVREDLVRLFEEALKAAAADDPA